jgi:hypothetical protein
MLLRLGPLLLLVLLLHGVASPFPAAASQTKITPVEIDVNGNTYLLAPADADAFQRRLNQPPKLKDPPSAGGPSYTVTTAYWDAAVREEDGDPAIEDAAEYFPQGGFVRTRQDGKDVWLVIDLRQRAILDHYILYGTTQRLPQDPTSMRAVLNPSALLVMFLAYYGQGEPIAIEVGDRLLTTDQADAFLSSVAPNLIFQLTFLDPPQPPDREATSGYWVTITLPEGRSLEYFYDTANATLTDALGIETFDLKAAAGGGIPESAEVAQIEQQSPAGSLLWWPIMIGGGVAFLVLAVWLRRRSLANRG